MVRVVALVVDQSRVGVVNLPAAHLWVRVGDEQDDQADKDRESIASVVRHVYSFYMFYELTSPKGESRSQSGEHETRMDLSW